MDRKKPASVTKVSAPIRYRLLVEDEFSTDENLINVREDIIASLYEQKKEHEKARDKLIRSYGIWIVIAYLYVRGSNIEIPKTSIQLSELPALLEISLFTICLTLCLLALKFSDILGHEAIIDGAVGEKFGKGTLKRQIIKSMYYPESNFFLMHQSNYDAGKVDKLNPLLFGKIFNGLRLIALAFVLLIILALFLVAPSYLAFSFLENDIIGILLKLFSVFSAIFSFTTLFVREYKHERFR